MMAGVQARSLVVKVEFIRGTCAVDGRSVES